MVLRLDEKTLAKKAKEIKLRCAELCIGKQKGHITSALSAAELLTVLYYRYMSFDVANPKWPDRDRFVMSKNHGSLITYPILHDLGFIDDDLFYSYQEDGSMLGTHSKIQIPGVDFSGGSLGIGLGVASGLAYASKVEDKKWKTYCMIGDCECHEGSIWEAIMFAGHNKLNNLIVIMDRNNEGCTDYISNLIPLNPLSEKMIAFGWDVFEVKNGHDISEIIEAYEYVHERNSTQPLIIIANTVKGYGIDSMLNQPWRHGSVPTGEEAIKAIEHLRKDYENAIK